MDTTPENQGSTTVAGSVCPVAPESAFLWKSASFCPPCFSFRVSSVLALIYIHFIRLGSISMIKGSTQLMLKHGEEHPL